MSYIDKLNATLDSPATSYWLGQALLALDSRDPIDALNDAEQLAKLATERLNEAMPPFTAGEIRNKWKRAGLLED